MHATPSPAPPTLSRAHARIVWSALAAAMVIAVVASIAAAGSVPPPPDPALAPILLAVAAGVAAIDLVLVYVVTAAIRRKAGTARGTPPAAAAGVQVIVAGSLALGPALFACVVHFLTRHPLALALVLPSAAVLLHWFPSEARWARITPASARQGGTPPRSMIRE